jgi:hypothetical protein
VLLVGCAHNYLDEPDKCTGRAMFAYTAEPGSKSEEGLKLLTSWAATPDNAQAAHAADRD